MTGYAAAFPLVATLQTLITTVTGVVFLDMSISESVAQTFALVLAPALLGITLGLLLSAFAHNEFQVAQFMTLAILPQVQRRVTAARSGGCDSADPATSNAAGVARRSGQNYPTLLSRPDWPRRFGRWFMPAGRVDRH